MSVRFIHTSDWHLGNAYASVEGDAAAHLRRARVDAAHKIAQAAAQHRVDAVLVAGDMFEHHAVSDAVIDQAVQVIEAWPGPWVLIPGNHDAAALDETVWTRVARRGMPANLHVALRPEPILLAQDQLAVLPAPLTARRTLDDASAWMDEARTPAGAARVGLAHGSVHELLPERARTFNPIAIDRAERARLDYLALGDWHGCLRIGPRTWYSGSPEPGEHGEADPGWALLVELPAPGEPASVERLPTACVRWRRREVDLSSHRPVGETLQEALSDIEEPRSCALSLLLRGAVSLEARVTLDLEIERAGSRFCHLRVEQDELVTLAGEQDLASLDAGPLAREVAQRLAALAEQGAVETRADAELALRLLWQENTRLRSS